MKHSMNLRFKIFIVLLASIIMSGCSQAPVQIQEITRSGFFFDTLVTITIYGTEDKTLLDDSFDMCRKYDRLLSTTIDSSDIARINRADTNPVHASQETLDILNAAIEYNRISDGKLDVSLGPVTTLWTKAREDNSLAESDLIKEALTHTGLDKFTIDKDMMCVYKSDPDAALDLGALGKGYVADRLKEMLVSRGVTSAIISLGGNIVTIGNKPNGTAFIIGIKKPFSSDNETAADLNVWDRSVVTSGVYERYVNVDKRIYHHIIDPKTGYPAATDIMSATVISDSSLDGDALSTICLLYGLDDAMKLINSTKGTEAIFITWDNELHYTSGASMYLNRYR